jgi:hypothetical protein
MNLRARVLCNQKTHATFAHDLVAGDLAELFALEKLISTKKYCDLRISLT